jgi:hypothetical protein
MWSKDELSSIKKYKTELLTYYKNNSRLKYLTQVVKNDKLNDYESIGKKYLLPNFRLEPNTYWVLSSFIQGLAMGEFQYIINSLISLDKNQQQTIKYNKLPNNDIIENALEKLDDYMEPNYMIVPINFFVDMHNWGMKLIGEHYIINYKNEAASYNSSRGELKIIWSNKFINLNQIIIGDKNRSSWQYIPDSETGDEITIEFEPEISDAKLFLQERFKYLPPYNDEISIIEFPKELTNIRDKNSNSFR